MSGMTDGACTVAELIFTEQRITSVLDWQLHPDTPFCWLTVTMPELATLDAIDNRILTSDLADVHKAVIHKYLKLFNVVLLDPDYHKFDPSSLSAAALALCGSSTLIESINFNSTEYSHAIR